MRGKNKKVLSAVSVVGLLVGLLAGCGMTQSGIEETAYRMEEVKKDRIALITKSMDSAFWKSVHSGASAACTEYNMKLLFQGPANEEDYETQNYMIAHAVKEGVDAIVFSAVDYEENADAIDQAAKKGVKIVVIDSDVNSEKVSSRIGTDNYEAGCTAGEAALDGDEEALNIGIVNFDESTENGQTREKGFRDTVMKDRRVSIASSINVESSVDSARESTKQMLRENPQINVLVTFNEWTSLGVGSAIKELGVADTTRVIAFDSNVKSVDMLETGEVDALIVQNPYAMGYLGVENAYKLLNGDEPEQEVDTEVQLVTRENMYDERCQRILFAFGEVY